ncbi:hypothetical protein [Clostridium sp. BJN0013]|mgnify:CR=1 FL=1|uniref:hypothetical protein n=1 Tax=Clostridium sp. BJN0013 TaxID=3236840 RepID=UPI0034C64931
MKRTGNSIDDLMQLALYMIPKYMKRIDRYNRRRYKDSGNDHDKEYYKEQYIDNKELIEFIEKNILRQEGILTGKRDKEKPKKTENEKTESVLDSNIVKKIKDKVEKKPENHDKKEPDKKIEIDNKKESEGKKASENKDKKEEENKGQTSKEEEEENKGQISKKNEEHNHNNVEKKAPNEKEEKEQITKPNGIVKKRYNILSGSKYCITCNKGISYVMNKLIGEKLDVCVKDDKMSILNEVNLIHSDEILIKLTNESGEKIIIPMKNIVGLQSNKLSSLDKSLKQVSKGYYCIFEKRMEDYFNSLIGKKVIIQTVGQGKFAYIYNKTITEVGLGFIVVDNSMMVVFSSIVLIRELKNTQSEKEM